MTSDVQAVSRKADRIGFRVLGSTTVGGKRYFFLLVSILGYFAMVSQRIPAHKAPAIPKPCAPRMLLLGRPLRRPRQREVDPARVTG